MACISTSRCCCQDGRWIPHPILECRSATAACTARRPTWSDQTARSRQLDDWAAATKNDGMKYGYARVSTDGQSVNAQVRQLRASHGTPSEFRHHYTCRTNST